MATMRCTCKMATMRLSLVLIFFISLLQCHLTNATEDVRSIGVENPAPNVVTLSAIYVENSPAMGVVFALLFTDDAGSVNFTKSVYLVLNRMESGQFTQGKISQGNYTILAFGVEENGRLEVGHISPAAIGSIVVSGQVICGVQSVCSASHELSVYELVRGAKLNSATLTCPESLSSLPGVTRVSWLLVNDTSTNITHLLEPKSDPHLEQDVFDLAISDVTADHEGIYFCQVPNMNVSNEASGCIYAAGRAFFKSCPGETCNPTALQGGFGGDVEFDTRVEFRHGGSCGVGVNIRLMFLDKLQPADDTTESVSVYVCSNLGDFADILCSDNMRVSVSFQGAQKYDIKLRLHNLNVADSGEYEVSIVTNDAFGQRITIIRRFELAVTGLPSQFPRYLANVIRNCTVQVNGYYLVVSCQFDNSMLLGYSVMVQLAGSLTLLTGEATDNSPVEFEARNNSLHNVIVFPLGENGIIGTKVAYTEQIFVTLPTTITSPPTNASTTLSTNAGASNLTDTDAGANIFSNLTATSNNCNLKTVISFLIHALVISFSCVYF